ncbi:MAG: Rieske 2Fe-2S domain-containing protein [Rhodospirillaceae bacterium]|nr:Rieske 2Fe-2S domain-containing protein [Rhodospirillaceae bacterium]MBT5296892.1 Rieske 2Fe-2S domain-containing protein [Rhodospirillaceae bacterium]MBT5513813.1 Rieske 2Fe-2S domain-containing protein [Rhodospirillaceae bacterium]MBT6085545.1 Rieske 2Fe-2S domain-containing protein [Rhodospirillaceae bacterium]MBT6609121.1 Rieske 2Fe-2S domain-containing protein [Rhodospirillaceae bacterium]
MTTLDTQLCTLNDVPDGGSNGFVLDTDDGRCGLMVIRRGNGIVCYTNSCPHIGTPLDIQPGKFLDRARAHILCTTHGALFNIDDGLCIAGPCVDDHLTPIATEVRDGAVFVDKQTLPTIWPPLAPVPTVEDL